MSVEINKELENQKEVAYYSSLVGAWISTKMERDKTILTISSGGIAILITLLSTIGIKAFWELWLYGLTFVFFITTIFLIIKILDKNSKYIERVLRKEIISDPKLKRLDKITMITFLIAILLSTIVGINSAYHKLNESNGVIMEESKSNKLNFTNGKPMKKSLDDLGKLSPQNLGDSLEGIGGLSPQANSGESSSAESNTSENDSSSNEKD